MERPDITKNQPETANDSGENASTDSGNESTPTEYGGSGQDPTIHGDWQHNGRCTDF